MIVKVFLLHGVKGVYGAKFMFTYGAMVITGTLVVLHDAI